MIVAAGFCLAAVKAGNKVSVFFHLSVYYDKETVGGKK